MGIRNFTPEIYYGIVSKAVTGGEEIELTSKEKFSKDELSKAQELCDKYNAEIKQIYLTDETKNLDELEDCFIKIKAYKKDFMNVVNDFSLYLLKWISNIRY